MISFLRWFLLLGDEVKLLTFKTFPYGWHPYLQCYSNALAKFGIKVIPGENFKNDILSDEGLTGVHFHWIEYLWTSSSFYASIKAILGFYSFLKEAKQNRKLILWTVHNHERHENKSWLDRIGYKIISNYADVVVVHSKWSKNFVQKVFKPSGHIVVMYHGNFIDYFRCNESIEDSRNRFNLDFNKLTVGIIGAIRRYRGHDIAIEVFQGSNIQLFIAGKCYDKNYLDSLAELDRSGIAIFWPQALSDSEYASAINACDVILLPYRKITTSGALLASWSLGRSVISPDQPYFLELIPQNSAAGSLFKDYHQIPSLFESLVSIPFEDRYSSSLEEARKYDWDKVVSDLISFLKTRVGGDYPSFG